MSNFTRSILYSTTVLAVGLVAIFAIYNSVTTSPDGASVAQISPAAGDSVMTAGDSDLGIIYDSDTTDVQSLKSDMSADIQNIVGPAAQDIADDINSAIDMAH